MSRQTTKIHIAGRTDADARQNLSAMPPVDLPPTTEAECQPVDAITQALSVLPCGRCTLIGLMAVIVIALLLHLLSPTRLCATLQDTLSTTERIYFASALAGVWPPSANSQTEMSEELRSLQYQASHIEERRVQNSLRPWCELWDMFTGHSFVIARCIWEIKVFKNRIELLQASRRREMLEAQTKTGTRR
ncbi:hypothetical protein C8F04DRAFT_153582 [Mycena alexandri]|uniref:Uncharacterized protein n=1 Tax=Mycena alexandri TaxID=1745969 RepID=A0AAD6WRQ5_9AGAR|nr:hypothetical protein C8F04DRAFT_153582 [Mycena alexandri]